MVLLETFVSSCSNIWNNNNNNNSNNVIIIIFIITLIIVMLKTWNPRAGERKFALSEK